MTISNTKEQTYKLYITPLHYPLWDQREFYQIYDRYVPPAFEGNVPPTLTTEQALKIVHIKFEQRFMKIACSVAATVFTVGAIFLSVFAVAVGSGLIGLTGPGAIFLGIALLFIGLYYWHNYTSAKELNSVIKEAQPQQIELGKF